jgi:uncharacterized protein
MLHALFAAVGFLYGAVGHGGASGYLAALALLGYPPAGFKASALLLNLLVAAISLWNFRRAGHFDWKLLRPFVVLSVPCAFIGGYVPISLRTYGLMLSATLVFAGIRLALPDPKSRTSGTRPSTPVALATGGILGLLSGMVGVGGGIFLSPLMILLGWADAKKTAAVSAGFIWINSAAGLAGALERPETGTLQPFALSLWSLALAAGAGGLAGSSLGANKATVLALRRLLSVVLLLAAYKMCTVWGQA